MKIAIAGLDYVRTAFGVLLTQKNYVVAIDIDQRKDLLNTGKSPIENVYVAEYLSTNELAFTATSLDKDAYVVARALQVFSQLNS